jgi:UPF0755 protein
MVILDMKLFLRITRIVVALLLVSGVALLWYLQLPVRSTETLIVYIPTASSASRVTAILSREGIVRYPSVMRGVLGAISRITRKPMHRGSYRFTPGDTHWSVVRAMVFGDGVLTVRVTFPEGISARRFASIIQSKLGSDSANFMRLVYADSLIEANNVPVNSLEGYLMPDTYDFYINQPAGEVLDRLLREQRSMWSTRFEKLYSSSTLGKSMSKHRVLTLASIVESETSVNSERARVAGVYLNRLRLGMKLAADPTVQYALGGEARRLLYRDLEIDNPYNTYRYAGLPPGPICSPGAASIEAVLNAESHSYLYFCALGDGSGMHAFAVTGSDHAKNVARYRRQRALRQ